MDDQTSFKIKVAEFEGPLDLLLKLIERHKLHISEISLSQVADEYLAYLNSFDHRPKRDMADFIIIASTLMLIKSFALLPTLSRTEEEESDIEELKRRLAIYQIFQNLTGKLKTNLAGPSIYFPSHNRNFEPVFTPSQDLKLDKINLAIKNLIARLPKPEKVPEAIVQKVISLETVIKNLTDRVQKSLKMNFSDFVKTDRANKMEVVICFLGLLELTKQGIIKAEQNVHFGDIALESEMVETPRY